MATARTTIKTALIKLRIVPAAVEPSALQAQQGLEELNALLTEWNGFTASHPFVPVRVSSGLEMDREEPSLRLQLQHSAAITILLPKEPQDGARIQISDPNNLLATHNVTLSRNGWQIDGVAANAVLNTAGLNRIYRFRADTGNWGRAQDLGLDDELPYPADLHRGIALILAKRMGGAYSQSLAREDAYLARAALDNLISRYVRPPLMRFDTSTARVGGAVYTYDGWDLISDG